MNIKGFSFQAAMPPRPAVAVAKKASDLNRIHHSTGFRAFLTARQVMGMGVHRP